MRRSSHVRRTTGAAVLAGAAIALSGCGMLGGEDAQDSGSSSPAATPSSAASTPAPSTGSSDSGSSAPADTAGKPAKAEVVAGLKRYYAQNDKSGAVDHDKLANCIADNGYGKLSAKTLNAMKDGNPAQLDAKDRATFTAISVGCAGKSVKSGLPSLPTEVPTNLPTQLPTNLPTEMPTG